MAICLSSPTINKNAFQGVVENICEMGITPFCYKLQSRDIVLALYEALLGIMKREFI